MEGLNEDGYIFSTTHRILWRYKLIIIYGAMWMINPGFNFWLKLYKICHRP